MHTFPKKALTNGKLYAIQSGEAKKISPMIPCKKPFTYISDILEQLKSFVYYSQDGNLGDLLIAEATRQLFSKLNVRYTLYHEGNLPEKYAMVHSGGGRFIPYWCNIEDAVEQLCNERITRCIILPSSFKDVDGVLEHFDERHTIFCRDPYSYVYCKSKCTKSEVYCADDMAFGLRLIDLRPVPTCDAEGYCVTDDEIATLQDIRNGVFKRLHHGILQASVRTLLNGKEKSVAFLFRTDKEKGTKYESAASFDASIVWHTTGSNMMFNGNMLRQFSHALKQVDVVVSDRLHVCVMAYLSGREVYMLDNNYGKVRGVYELTLADVPMMHLLADGNLTPDLDAAWQKLNAEHAEREAAHQRLVNSKRIKLLVFLGKCRRFPRKIIEKFIRIIHSWATRG